ncbi:Bro-N domain-containing protein [Candidatus Woesearchaeota archaeon]|nr:Bro-N domain-containing protein [Candidatus Woesearchaeota archaeon]
MEQKSLVLFENKQIRRAWYNAKWWFVIEDVISVLTDSKDPKGYIKDMRRRDEILSQGWGQIATPLSFPTAGGVQNINCASTEGIFRIIQSIPSPKAEPFKQWLAKVGYERVQEIENPELSMERMKDVYRLKGYSDEWIEKRTRGIAVRQELTDEWKARGAQENKDFAILTNEISKATFGKTVEEYKEHKNLSKQNLRDHMDDMELILTMLGEATTTRLTKERDSEKLPALKKDAKDGGDVAGATRKDIEKRIGKSIVSSDNYLETPEKVKRLEK